jgi:hypothetical protein
MIRTITPNRFSLSPAIPPVKYAQSISYTLPVVQQTVKVYPIEIASIRCPKMILIAVCKKVKKPQPD